MICSACGTPAVAGVNFCAKCGAAIIGNPQYASAPPPPVAAHYGIPYMPQPRVQKHLQALGILWYVFAAYRAVAGIIGALVLSAFFGHHSHMWFGGPFGPNFGDSAPHWIAGAMVPVVIIGTVAAVAFSAATGWGLLNRQPWGRTVAIIAAILALFKFPFGTALGIYTLWVIAPAESRDEWDAIAGRS